MGGRTGCDRIVAGAAARDTGLRRRRTEPGRRIGRRNGADVAAAGIGHGLLDGASAEPSPPLGADLASMSINPAGLGMYRRNEIALTPMMTFQSSETPGTMSYAKNGKNRFSMANFGAALNAYEGTGTLTSFTVGIGLNRIADFNSRYSYKTDTPYAGGSVWRRRSPTSSGSSSDRPASFPTATTNWAIMSTPITGRQCWVTTVL